MNRPGLRACLSILLLALLLGGLLLSRRPGARPSDMRAGPGYLPPDAPLTAPAAPPARKGARGIPFELLSAYDYDPEADLIPEEVRALHGTQVELIGVMYYAVEDSERVTEFFLMPNHMICCFGTPRLNEAVEVLLRPGLRTRYLLNYFIVRGRIEIGAVRDDDGRVLFLYRIAEASAEALQ